MAGLSNLALLSSRVVPIPREGLKHLYFSPALACQSLRDHGFIDVWNGKVVL